MGRRLLFLRDKVMIQKYAVRLKRFGKSLQLRLFLILILVGILPIYIVKFGILRNYENQAAAQRAGLIVSRCQMISRQLVESGYLNGAESPVIETELTQLGSLWSGRVVVLNRNFRIIRDTFGIDEDKILIAEEVLKSFTGTSSYKYNHGERFLEVTVPVRLTDTESVEGLLILSVPTDDIIDGKRELSSNILILQITLIVIMLVIAFYASRILARPFSKVTASLDERSAFLEEDISIPGYTETELLAEAYNRMRQRMRSQEESRQEFVSNVSHELKTPLTSMKVLSDSLVSQEDVPVELYREFMSDIAEEIDRENKIITDLLSLVKMDRKSADINIRETNINDLIALILKRLRPIAARQNVELVQENDRPVFAEVDETKLTLAITNLVENGIKYNKPDGWVHVSLNSDNSFFYVKVEDSGMGIPEESLPKIFERFYRVDKSHSKEIGGTGLGLAITRSAVEMHHGAVRCYSREGEGTTFTIRIPLKYSPQEELADE